MVSLGSWMNEILINWGVDPKLANMFDETIIAVLMIGVSIGLDYLCQAIFVAVSYTHLTLPTNSRV